MNSFLADKAHHIGTKLGSFVNHLCGLNLFAIFFILAAPCSLFGQTAPLAGTFLWSRNETNDAVLVSNGFVYSAGSESSQSIQITKASAVTGSIIWSKIVSGPSHIYAIKSTQNGNLYVVGTQYVSDSTGTYQGYGVVDISTDGNVNWQTVRKGSIAGQSEVYTVYSVELGTNDNLYVAGRLDESWSAYTPIAFIHSYTTNGNFASIGTTRNYDECLGIALDESNDLFYTSYDPALTFKPATGRLAGNGSSGWTNSSYGGAPCIAVSTDGVLCVASTNKNSIVGLSTIDGHPLWTNGTSCEKLISAGDCFYAAKYDSLTKISSTGTTLWSNSFNWVYSFTNGSTIVSDDANTFSLSISPNGYVFQSGYVYRDVYDTYYGTHNYPNAQSFVATYTASGVPCYTNLATVSSYQLPSKDLLNDFRYKYIGYAPAANARSCADQFDNFYSVDFPLTKCSGPAPIIYVNGSLVDGEYSSINPVTVTMASGYRDPSSVILYTLDGSTPDYGSAIYSSPIIVSNNATVRALGVDVNTFEEMSSAPVVVNISQFELTTALEGAGSVIADPSPGPYLSNTVVTVSAVASNGWMFQGWSGDISGTNNPETVVMNGSKSVQATFIPLYEVTLNAPLGGGTLSIVPLQPLYPSNFVATISATAQTGWYFLGWSGDANGTNASQPIAIDKATSVSGQFGTTLRTAVLGPGSISLDKDTAVIQPYGTKVRATAVPNAGYFFTKWGGALYGTNNPSSFFVTTTNSANAFFGVLPAGNVSLTVHINGDGDVITSPLKSYYAQGEIVTLTASPNGPTNQFVGWSGDLSRNTLSSQLALDVSKDVTATFVSGLPSLQVSESPTNPGVISIYFLGATNYPYILQTASNLAPPVDWQPIFTNPADVNGNWQFTDTNLSGGQKFYRVLGQ